jgi:acyl-CoA reductase-like NAD-dependent aldehyde dehydrogenase
VLKPSEIAPMSGVFFAQVCHDAGVPAGVFNLVNGTGPDVGARMSSHPNVDMVSFTGSTRAGTAVAAAAAPTVKRVAQELGGKSPNIILPSADLEAAVKAGVEGCFGNTGQSCDAPTRMFIHRSQHDQALEFARAAANSLANFQTTARTTAKRTPKNPQCIRFTGTSLRREAISMKAEREATAVQAEADSRGTRAPSLLRPKHARDPPPCRSGTRQTRGARSAVHAQRSRRRSAGGDGAPSQ